MGVIGTSTSQGRTFCIQSLFWEFYTSSKRYIRGVYIPFIPNYVFDYHLGAIMPKIRRLRPQNGPISSGHEKI
jgi:hypothetical protein